MRKSRYFALACLASVLTLAAQPSEAPIQFEVASVKPAPPPSGGGMMTAYSGGPGSRDPGTIVYTNASLSDLVMRAYGLKPYQLSAPRWLATARFDIVAKVPSGATRDQVPEMWRALLAERFQLAVHQEQKELPEYDLVVSKNGPKLKESAKDDGSPAAPVTNKPGPRNSGGATRSSATSSDGAGTAQIGFGSLPGGGGGRSASGLHKISGGGVPASRIAEILSQQLDRPVVDKTGLTGTYDFALSYSDDKSSTAADGTLEAPSAPLLPTALDEQLGLRLEARKGLIDILVVDHAEKVPTGN